MANLADFVNAIKNALVGAGYAPTDANVQKAIDLWNAVGGANMSTADFVAAIQYSFSSPQGGGQRPATQNVPGYEPYSTYGTQLTPTQAAAPQPTSGGVDYSQYTLDVQPGLPQKNWELEQERYWKIAQLEAQTSQDIANIQASASRYVADLNASTQRALQSGDITAQEAMLAKQLAQQEAEFARDLALRQLISDRDYEISKAQLELQNLEVRSQLAANPTDWLTYQAFTHGGQLPGVGASAPEGLPAADETIRQTAEGLTQGGTLYNPQLSGEGVAGAHVPGPQEVGRYQLYNMNPTDLEMLTGFLRSGIDINGKRVAINPEDWFQQSERSWIPTLPESTFVPQYSF